MTSADQASVPDIAPGLEQALELDRLVNDPARLLILGVLNGADDVSFKFMTAITKLSRGNLSIQMAKLEEAGYITIHKRFKGKVPYTSYSITPLGMEALTQQIQRMEAYVHGYQSQEEEKQRLQHENAPHSLPSSP